MRPRFAAALLLLFLAAAFAGCSGKDPLSAQGSTGAGSAGGSGAGGEATDGGTIAWVANADHYRGQDGQRYRFTCPAGGEPKPVWGTDTFTDDSSVCTAGVFAGRITLADGGQVTVEIRPGEQHYAASERNGITTIEYGPFDGSFVVA